MKHRLAAAILLGIASTVIAAVYLLPTNGRIADRAVEPPSGDRIVVDKLPLFDSDSGSETVVFSDFHGRNVIKRARLFYRGETPQSTFPK